MTARNMVAVIFAPLAVCIVAGCSSTPPNAALQQAHSVYNSAAADPGVSGLGDLARAKAYLDSADLAESKGADQAEVTHRAYLATQQVKIAQETANLQKVATRFRNTPRAMTASGNVFFATGAAKIAPGTDPTLDKVVTYLQQNHDQRVEIDGFTDNTGSQPVNMKLSQRRADAVRDALVARGIEPNRIEARGNGDASPVASNDSAHGRQMNRRAVVMMSNVAESTGSSSPSSSSGQSNP